MVYCSVPFCKSRQCVNKGVSFYKFPSDTATRQQWVLAISRQGNKPGLGFAVPNYKKKEINLPKPVRQRKFQNILYMFLKY